MKIKRGRLEKQGKHPSSGTFEQFLSSLQHEVSTAQQAIQEQQDKLLRRYFDIQPDGELKAVTWNVVIPSGKPGKHGENDDLELPLLTLLSPSRHKIAEVALEFEAEVEEHPDNAVTGRKNLVLVVKKTSHNKKTNSSRVKVVMAGAQPGRIDVYVDDVLFKTLDSTPQTLPAVITGGS